MSSTPTRKPDEEPDLSTSAIIAMIQSIESNLDSLYHLLEHYPQHRRDYRRMATRLEHRLADAVDGPPYNRPHAQLTEEFLRIRTAFWIRLLSTPDPRRTFVRWLKHLDEIASGRRHCVRFEREVLGE